MARKRFLSNLALAALLTLSYFAAGKFGLMLAFVNPSATAVWPPTGIALAAFLLLGNQIWPGILLGAFLVNVTTSGSLPASIAIAVGNTLEGVVGAHLVNRLAQGRQAFDRAYDIFKFAILAGLLSTTVSATFGVTTLALNGLATWADYAPIWLTWWLGDAGGALIVTPVLMLWAMDPHVRWNRSRAVEAALLLLSLILLGLAVFSGLSSLGVKNYALEFTFLPLVVWAAFRFGRREAATGALILSGMAIWGTLHGFGPFARVPPNEALLLLQAFMGTMTIMGLGLAAVVAERQQIDTAVWEANEKMRYGLIEVERRNREMAVLAEMSDLLQSCLTVEEAYAVITQSAPQLFPDEAGALYTMSAPGNLLEAAVVWGDYPSVQRIFSPNDCWALRRGRTYVVSANSTILPCAHLTNPAPACSLCLPMIAHGEILGVLHLQGMAADRLTPATQQLSQTVADSLALALANLRLRESLRQQSIRDPLTSLFNRRYLEESLERELRRATRSRSPVGLILLDIDHFKRFNDNFGHAAGDLLLREMGAYLKTCIRGGDIACRYGGEEFLLLFPEASLETAQHRAEEVRAGIKQLQVSYQAGPLGPITLSLGVAVFPLHGLTSEALLQVADLALYRAKHDGGDRVIAADITEDLLDSTLRYSKPE